MVPLKISKARSRIALGLIVVAHLALLALFQLSQSLGTTRQILGLGVGILVVAVLIALFLMIIAVTLTDRRKIWWMALPVLTLALASMALFEVPWGCASSAKTSSKADVCVVAY